MPSSSTFRKQNLNPTKNPLLYAWAATKPSFTRTSQEQTFILFSEIGYLKDGQRYLYITIQQKAGLLFNIYQLVLFC